MLRLNRMTDYAIVVLGHSVAILVFQIENVRRSSHEEPPLPTDQSRRPLQPRRKSGCLLIAPVSVEILQELDASQRFLPSFGIATHLRHEEASMFIEGDRDRIYDLGLASHELDPEIAVHLKGFQRLVKVLGRIAREFDRIGNGLGPSHPCQQERPSNEQPGIRDHARTPIESPITPFAMRKGSRAEI